MCALNVSKKAELIEQYKTILKDAQIAILAEYSGSKVQKVDEIRKKLKEEKAGYCVIKNTLFKMAAKGSRFESLIEEAKGPLALVTSSMDIVGPAKVMDAVFSDEETKYKFRAAVGGTNYEKFSEKHIKALAKLPSREVLLSKFLGSLRAPAQNLLGVLQAVPRNLVSVLSQVSKKSE
jgi:large subunit ribosomal protein L10